MADGKYIKYVTIYGLVDMNDNIRYVGVTSRKPIIDLITIYMKPESFQKETIEPNGFQQMI